MGSLVLISLINLNLSLLYDPQSIFRCQLCGIIFSADKFRTAHNAYIDQEGWKAGVAKTVITPEGELWMAGYANRYVFSGMWRRPKSDT